jgi:hypothetical protein
MDPPSLIMGDALVMLADAALHLWKHSGSKFLRKAAKARISP